MTLANSSVRKVSIAVIFIVVSRSLPAVPAADHQCLSTRTTPGNLDRSQPSKISDTGMANDRSARAALRNGRLMSVAGSDVKRTCHDPRSRNRNQSDENGDRQRRALPDPEL